MEFNDKCHMATPMIKDTETEELASLLGRITEKVQHRKKEIEVLTKTNVKDEELAAALRAALSARMPHGTPTGYGQKAETLREAIRKLPEQRFTQPVLESMIQTVNPAMEINRVNIRSALWKLAKNKHIKVIKPGTNSTPTLYERVDEFFRVVRHKNGSNQVQAEIENEVMG
jgi:hypothetical protein